MPNSKVLQVMYPFESDGVTQVVLNYAKHLDPQRVQMDFLLLASSKWSDNTLKEDPRFQEILARGGNIYVQRKPSALESTLLPMFLPRFIRRWFGMDKAQSQMEQLIQREKYNVVHCHLTKEFRFAMRTARDAGIECRIIHSHNCVKNEKTLRKREFMLWWQGQYPATHFWGCSRWANMSRYGRKLVESHRSDILPNAIDCKRFTYNSSVREDYRKKLDVENKFVLGHVGRFSEQKNQMFILDIFKAFHDKHPQSSLILVGKGKDEQKLRDYAQSLGLDADVQFLIDRKDVDALYQAFDVFVFPSIIEGLPLVAVEAQSSGLPIVMAKHLPEETRVISEIVGLCELKDSPEIWCRKIEELTENYERKGTLDTMIAKGWQIEDATEKLMQFYEKAVDDPYVRLNKC